MNSTRRVAIERRKLTRWEWEKALRDSDLSAGARTVALWASTWGDKDGSGIYPSLEALAAACRMDARTVKKYRDEAERVGWLVCVVSGGGRHRPNVYRLAIPERGAPDAGESQDETPARGGGESLDETPSSCAEKPPHPVQETPSPRAPRPDHDQTNRPEKVMAEIAWHRHSADARDGDDADATRQEDPMPNPSRAADVRELAGKLAHARGIPT